MADNAVAPAAEAPADPAIETPTEGAEAAPEKPVEGEEARAPEPEAPKPEPRKHKLKIDGELRELEEEELYRMASLGGAAYKRMEEAAQIKKGTAALVAAFTKDPVGTLLRIAEVQKIPIDQVKGQMAELLQKDYEASQLDPKEKEAAELKARVEAYERQEKEAKARAQTEAEKAATDEALQHLDVEITEALKDSGLPKTPKVVARMAELLERDLRLGLNRPAKELVRYLQDEVTGSQKQLVSALEGEQLVKFLGEDVIKKVRAFDAAQAKQHPAAAKPVPRSGSGPVPRNGAPAKKPMNESEWRKTFGRY
jgi:hypothetical protein